VEQGNGPDRSRLWKGPDEAASNPHDIVGLRIWVLPLMLATGAGAGAQKAMAPVCLVGSDCHLLVTLFAPLFYVLIEKAFGKRRRGKAAKTDDVNPSEEDK